MTSANGMATPTTTTTVHHPKPEGKVDAKEVGWQFVPQYYTFVNKHPARLHCFYTKNSTFIHGTEGEEGRPCYGQQEIHNKILTIGFEDCKVFIHSVDAQSSANNGIIIQVIGEMSNQAEPWRKFVQTFFLAEQPNGYFVLNDIFRFLKEETVGEGEDEDTSDGEPGVDTDPATQEPVVSGHVHHQTVLEEPAVAPPVVPSPAPPAELEPPINGFHDLDKSGEGSVDTAPAQDEAEKQPDSPPPADPSPLEEPATIPRPATPPPAPVVPSPTLPPAAVIAPEPTAPIPAPLPVPQVKAPPAAPIPAPTPSAPAAPKTWANLAAANSMKWGSQVAQEAKGVSAAAPPAPAPVNPGPGNQQRGAAPAKTQQQQAAATAVLGVTTGQTFVKSVTENVTEMALKDVLTSRFGPIKELEIVRSKACAFLEFVSVEPAKRAIVASLPATQGGEGGIRIPTENGDYTRIIVEMRKERADRPAPRPRGPASGPTGAPAGNGFTRGGGPAAAGGAAGTGPPPNNANGPSTRGGAGGDRGGYNNNGERGGFRGGSVRGRGRGATEPVRGK